MKFILIIFLFLYSFPQTSSHPDDKYSNITFQHIDKIMSSMNNYFVRDFRVFKYLVLGTYRAFYKSILTNINIDCLSNYHVIYNTTLTNMDSRIYKYMSSNCFNNKQFNPKKVEQLCLKIQKRFVTKTYPFVIEQINEDMFRLKERISYHTYLKNYPLNESLSYSYEDDWKKLETKALDVEDYKIEIERFDCSVFINKKEFSPYVSFYRQVKAVMNVIDQVGECGEDIVGKFEVIKEIINEVPMFIQSLMSNVIKFQMFGVNVKENLSERFMFLQLMNDVNVKYDEMRKFLKGKNKSNKSHNNYILEIAHRLGYAIGNAARAYYEYEKQFYDEEIEL